MGIGIAFTFLFIAALAAPVLWLAWWVAGSLGGGGRLTPITLTVGAEPAMKKPSKHDRFDRPRPADVNLISRPGAVAMYTRTDRTEVATCHGPDHAGRCPRVAAGGTVPCAGMVLSLPRPISGSTEWHIPSGYRACMLGSFGVFRQAAPGS
jgi:hypothetical protein